MKHQATKLRSGAGMPGTASCLRAIVFHSSFRGDNGAAILFLAPNFIGFALFTLIPVAASLLLSFYQWDLFTRPRFAGLRNHVFVWHDPHFRQAVGNTLFLMLRIPVSVVLSLLLAIGLNRATRVTWLLRTAYFLPSIIAGV